MTWATVKSSGAPPHFVALRTRLVWASPRSAAGGKNARTPRCNSRRFRISMLPANGGIHGKHVQRVEVVRGRVEAEAGCGRTGPGPKVPRQSARERPREAGKPARGAGPELD